MKKTKKPVIVKPGEVYNRFTVIAEITPKNQRNKPHVLHNRFIKCRCSCGNEKVLKLRSLIYGEVKSCGCLVKEKARVNMLKAKEFARHANHSGVKAKGTHEYESYRNMKTRCYCKSHGAYKWYGGKGIKVCERWLEPHGFGFKNFLEDMGTKPSPKHQIDRIDSDKDYAPENCRWATHLEQQHNKKDNLTRKYRVGEVHNGVVILEQYINSYKVLCFCKKERIISGGAFSKIALHQVNGCRCK